MIPRPFFVLFGLVPKLFAPGHLLLEALIDPSEVREFESVVISRAQLTPEVLDPGPPDGVGEGPDRVWPEGLEAGRRVQPAVPAT